MLTASSTSSTAKVLEMVSRVKIKWKSLCARCDHNNKDNSANAIKIENGTCSSDISIVYHNIFNINKQPYTTLNVNNLFKT